MTEKNWTARMDGGAIIVESSDKELDRDIRNLGLGGLSGALDAQEVDGGIEVDGNGMLHDLSMTSGDSSRKLAPGELRTTTVTGMPIANLAMADSEKVLVEVGGMQVQLSQALALGLVQVSNNMVTARETVAPPKPAKPADPMYLGDKWADHRRKIGSSADNALLSVMSKVLDGKTGEELTPVLTRFNEVLGLGAADASQAAAVYTQLSENLLQGMGHAISRALPREVPADDGLSVAKFVLEQMAEHERIGLLTRAIHGDRSWVPDVVRWLRREVRHRA